MKAKTGRDKPGLRATTTNRLIFDLSSKDKEMRRVAAEQLGRLRDKRAIKPLIEASGRGGGERARRAAILALARIGKPAIIPLTNTLLYRHETILRRASAAEALGHIGGRRAVSFLLKAMNDPSIDVRLHTVVSLARLKVKAAVPSMAKALSDESGGVRVNAAAALGKLRSKDAVEPLVGALKDEKWYVRQEAAKSLGLIGDKRAADALTLAAGDSRRAVAEAAREALEKLTQKGL